MKNTILINEILKIKVRLIELCDFVVNQHTDAFGALLENDTELAEKVIARDQEIDKAYISIKNDLSFIFAKEPLAKYLRRAVSYLIISKELERIGDYAKHIAKFIVKTKKKSKSTIKRIENIYIVLIDMLQQLSYNIDVERNEELIKLAQDDDVVDNKTAEVTKELVISFSKNKHSTKEIEERVYLLNLVNSLERAGDHIINICESLYYIINGEYCRL